MQYTITFNDLDSEVEKMKHCVNAYNYFRALKEILSQALKASRHADTKKDEENIFLRSSVNGSTAAFIFAGLQDLIEDHMISIPLTEDAMSNAK